MIVFVYANLGSYFIRLIDYSQEKQPILVIVYITTLAGIVYFLIKDYNIGFWKVNAMKKQNPPIFR